MREPQTSPDKAAAAGVRVGWTRRIYADDRWSGWPDIVRWRGTYYVCFANGSAHGSRDHSILLITSENLEVWTEPKVVLGPPGDHLESFFLATEERLFIHASWRDGDQPVHTDIILTEDAKTWSDRKQGYDDRYIFWGQSKHDGMFYVAAHIDPPVCENYLLASRNGEQWKQISLITSDRTTETTLCSLSTGELMSLSRRSPRDFVLVCFADPPYTEWRPVKTDTVLEGAAVAEIGERIVAMGRCSEFEGQESIARWYDASRRTGIFFYANGGFRRQALLPSGGDTGYPGILPLEDHRALVVWYSEHERMQDADYQYKRCASIYLATIAITE